EALVGGSAGPATPCTLPEAGGTGWAGPGGSPQPVPAPESQVECMLALWATPQGFLKAAIANNAKATKEKGATKVQFIIGGKYRMSGIINAQNQIERVQMWIGQSIVGDMLVETEYSGYRDFGGVQFPSHSLQKHDIIGTTLEAYGQRSTRARPLSPTKRIAHFLSGPRRRRT